MQGDKDVTYNCSKNCKDIDYLFRRLGEPAAMDRQDSQEGLRVTLAEMEKVK